MKKSITCALALSLFACSGGDKKADEQPTGDESGGVVAQCDKEAEVALKQAEMFANVTPGSIDAATAAYVDYQRVVERWQSEDNPCAAEGPDVTARMTKQKEVDKALVEAEAEGTAKLADFLSGDVDASRTFLKTVFGAGRQPSNPVLEVAHSVDRRYRERLLVKFRETEKYGQLGELETTCVFGTAEIDPNAEEITENFQAIFKCTDDVHALCRSPLPANKYGGDEAGTLVLILDDDDDPSNGVINEGDLGPIEKWGSTQWFSGRFSMPQGEPAKADAGYYHVWLKAKRPNMGDEVLADNVFFWHRGE
jgi:hypothetical protein